MFFDCLELFWGLRISDVVAVQIDDADMYTVFYFAVAQRVQIRLPSRVVFQVLGNMSGEQDVSRIAAVHYALRDVNSGSGEVDSIVDIVHLVNWPAVNAHSNRQPAMILQSCACFQRTLRG